MRLEESIDVLRSIVHTAEGKLEPDVLAEATHFLTGADVRRAQDMESTVVAFAGATGSGKSSLFNALIRRDLARVAATRPTTSEIMAVSAPGTGRLLDSFGVTQRVELPGEDLLGSGLVLLDLPDIDSTEVRHHEESARLISRADVVVWVLDPQKYADAVVHEDYVRAMTEHTRVMLVVLNQIDRVPEAERAGVLRDLRRVLSDDGVDARTIVTSAVSGEGISELRGALAEIAKARTAAAERLAADVRTVAGVFAGAVRDDGGTLEPHFTRVLGSATPGAVTDHDEGGDVTRLIAAAAGVSTVAHAAGESYRVRATSATSWPPARIFRRVDPLARLHLGRAARPDEDAPATNIVASPADIAAARAGVSSYVRTRCGAMPALWRTSAEKAAAQNMDSLMRRADETIAHADLGQERTPPWWALWNLLHWLAFMVTLAGAGWLALLWAGDAFRFLFPEPPMVGPIALPTFLLIVGAAVSFILALIARWLRARGAARTERRVRAELESQVGEEARLLLIEPVAEHVAEYGAFAANVRSLATATA